MLVMTLGRRNQNMKSLLLLLVLASAAYADTFVAYIVRGSPDLFTNASDGDIISRITRPDAVLEVYIETEGNSATGTIRTHKIEYAEAWDEADKPTSTASREVGTRFRAIEEGDKVSFEFYHTTLERWVALKPSTLRLQPVFQSREANSDIVLTKGQRVIFGGLTTEELYEGTPRKVIRYIIIERK